MLYGDNIIIQEVTEDRIEILVSGVPFTINEGDTVSILVDEFARNPRCGSEAELDHHVTFQELRDDIVGGDTGIFPSVEEYGFLGRYSNMCGIGRDSY